MGGFESEEAGEADEGADFQNAIQAVDGFTEAVEDAANFSGEWFHLGDDVIEGITLVDDAVKCQFGGDFHLLAEDAGLFCFVSVLIAFGHAVEREPSDWYAWLELALLAYREQRLSAALTDIAHARSANPTDPLLSQVERRIRAGKTIDDASIESKLAARLSAIQPRP